MKHFCVFVALWYVGTSTVLPLSNSSSTVISARHPDPDNQFSIRDIDEWESLLQARGKAPQKAFIQSSPGNPSARPHSAQLEAFNDTQHTKNPSLKRDRTGVPLSSPSIRSLNSHKSSGTNGNLDDKAALLSSQATPLERNVNLNHENQQERSGTIAPSHHMKQSAIDQLHSKDLASPESRSGLSTDHQSKEIASRMAHMRMPPPPPRPNRHIVMGYPVDSIIGRNWANYENPIVGGSKPPDRSNSPTKPDSSPTLTRRSAIPVLDRRGCSPASLEQCSFFGGKRNKKAPTSKKSDLSEQPSQKSRFHFWLPGNTVTQTSQPPSEPKRRPGMDLGSRQKSDSSDTSGRNAPVPSVYETPAYFRNSWRHSHNKNNPSGDDDGRSGTVHKRSALFSRAAAPAKEATTAQSFARDPVAEEALRNAAARARPINQYPPIDHRVLNGQMMQPPRSPSGSTYPVIPPTTPLPNGFTSRRPSNSG